MSERKLTQIAASSAALCQLLAQQQHCISTAESCTGGWVAQSLTTLAGSSTWFERGFVCYSNAAKQEMLGVSAKLLEQFGAVSEECAAAMALGALHHSHANWALAVTGIAGPSGGSAQKPVGTVCFAWAGLTAQVVSETHCLRGDRFNVRAQAVVQALDGMYQYLRRAEAKHFALPSIKRP
ncbi:MAG: nicotinamide-nucleotide amidohydrolase family protein [Pseudomonadota bacterium]